MVAIEFAASCRPFRKSNASATPMRAMSSRPGPVKSTRDLKVLDQHAADLVGHVLEPVDDLFEVVVDLRAHDVGHRIRPRRAAVEGAQAVVVEVVRLVLEA